MAELAWLTRLPARMTPDCLPRVALGLGIGSTVAANIAAGGRGGAGGAVIGAIIPAAFLVALEILILLVRRLARQPWGWLWCTGAGLPLAGVAAITGIVSYLHALTVAEWTGSTGTVAHLIPLVPDQLIICGSVALVALAVAPGDRKPAAVPRRERVPQDEVPQHQGSQHQGTQHSGPRAGKVPQLVSQRERSLVQQLLKQGPGVALPSARALARDELGNNQRAAGRVLANVSAVRDGVNGHG